MVLSLEEWEVFAATICINTWPTCFTEESSELNLYVSSVSFLGREILRSLSFWSVWTTQKVDLLSLPSYRSFVFTKGPMWNKVQGSFVHMIENYCIHLLLACPLPLNSSSPSPLLPPSNSEHTQVQDHCNWECYEHLGTNTGNVDAILSFRLYHRNVYFFNINCIWNLNF